MSDNGVGLTQQSTPLFKRLVILGVGLMGGSLASALREAGLVDHVVGWGRNSENLQKAQSRGVIDSWSLDLKEAVSAADVVVVATPTQLAEQLMVEVVRLVGSETIVTDVASVKANLVSALQQAFEEIPSNVVLGHPIAGSEKSGIDAVDASLYQRHKVILIEGRNQAALERIAGMWSGVGAEVSMMSSEQHDAVLALTSHMPHLLSYALVCQIAESDLEEDVFAYAAGGLRDFSRVAGSDSTMWAEILLANKQRILESMEQYDTQLQSLRSALLANDRNKLESTFAFAREHRNRFADAYAVRTANKKNVIGPSGSDDLNE